MQKAYRFRLYPNKKQPLIRKTFGCCRFVFNHFLARRVETEIQPLPACNNKVGVDLGVKDFATLSPQGK